MLVSDFNFELPVEQIAQQPPEVRGSSRLLRLSRADGAWQDDQFPNFPELLQPGDLLVLNESRVIPARLFAQRPSVQRKRTAEHPVESAPREKDERIEVLLTEQTAEWEWRVLARPARKLIEGQELIFSSAEGEILLQATVTGRGEYGERLLRWTPVEDFYARLERLGHMPLPPYIRRQDHALDRERYQTVFARERGSVAAPTAGLHFTPEILERIRSRGVRISSVTLHVGLGTFQPVRVSRLDEIELHSERYTLPAATAAEIRLALEEGRRIIAVGTTTVRTLEHCAQIGRLEAHSGSTRIFISPGFSFRVVSGLLTNFHLPQSTLLMLVCALGGRERVLAAYHHAVREGYRFFSYGDCMFLS